MPRPLSLPDTAWNHMNIQAAVKIVDHAQGIGDPPGSVFTSTAADETWTATNGADLFYFNAETPQGNDVILGYDPSEDRIEVDNVNGWSIGPEGVLWVLGISTVTFQTYEMTVDVGFTNLQLDPYDSLVLHSAWDDYTWIL